MKPAPRSEGGYTLVETMVVLMIVGLLLTLGVGALRQFWFHRALEGGADEVVAELRQLQVRSVSESHPLVYGAMFTKNEATWRFLQFDPNGNGTADDSCTSFEKRSFNAQVTVGAATDFEIEPILTETCRTQLLAGATDEFVFFYSRGTASPGSVVLESDVLDRSETITVGGLTSRIDQL